MSSHFVWLNRGKESVVLDLKDKAAQQAVHRLLEKADVFVQNLAPGAADRLGLGAEKLVQSHPRLIACSISGYGGTGPYKEAKAYDALIQAEAGLVSITGSEEQPAKSGIPVADIAAGMYAFSGILAALYERARTDRGTTIEVSLFDSLIEWMGYPLYYANYGGTAPARTGTSHAAIAPYGVFRAGDGTEILVSVQSEREWRQFCSQVLQDPELANDARFATGSLRVQNRSQLHGVIESELASIGGHEFENRLAAGQIAHSRVRNLESVLEHPQLTLRHRWTQVQSPVGALRVIKPPITYPGRESAMGAIPALGADTGAVLAEIGVVHPPLPTPEGEQRVELNPGSREEVVDQ